MRECARRDGGAGARFRGRRKSSGCFFVYHDLNMGSFALPVTAKFYDANLARGLLYNSRKGDYNNGTARTSHVMIG